jgi:aminoglycoside 6-adenylyltransferase
MQYKREVEAFWYGAVYVAKQIRRRQLWTVQYRDWTMKGSLLAIIEWHAQFVHHKTDTWYEGRSIHEWADEETLLMLGDAFPQYAAADSWRALQTTINII